MTEVFTKEQIADMAQTKAEFGAAALEQMEAKRKKTPNIPTVILLDCWIKGAISGAAAVLYAELCEEAHDGVEAAIMKLVMDAVPAACKVARETVREHARGGRDADDSVH